MVALEADLGVALELTPVLACKLVLEKAVVLLVDAHFQFSIFVESKCTCKKRDHNIKYCLSSLLELYLQWESTG